VQVTATAATPAPDAILAQAKAAYAALKTYADTGAVDLEFGTGAALGHEHHMFRTAYRAPRQFYFDFTKAGNADRYVAWGDGETFHSYWKATGIANNYPKGQGSSAFSLGSTPTATAVLKVAPLLFPAAGLSGTLTEFGQPTLAGTEKVDGHDCYKLTGIAHAVYGTTGHETDRRQTTVWIDTQTSMVRKVFEDRTEGQVVSRMTTRFEPQVNPIIDDKTFRFIPPVH
jgi:outer membrane lipoprotein-sorting protein